VPDVGDKHLLAVVVHLVDDAIIPDPEAASCTPL